MEESTSRHIPRLRVLNEEQLRRIHEAALVVMEGTGLIIKHGEAQNLLEKAGAKVEEERVRIPRSLVDWAIDTAPSHLTIYDQKGNPALRLGERNPGFGSGPTTPYTIDVETGERRKVVAHDVGRAARLMDALENIDFVMSMGLISDCLKGLEDLYEFRELLFHTHKPLCGWGYNRRSYALIRDMAIAVKGTLEKLQQEPFYILYSEPSTPLLHTKEALEKVLFMAEHRLPMVHTSGAAAGGVAPVTLAGLMVVCTAEVLTGILIAQLKNPGTPCLFGYAAHIMDMKTTICSYGCPEHALGQAATVDQAQFYQLPSWGYAGCSDAKILDGQVAVESTFHNLMTGLSGANFAHDVGFLESGMTSSLTSLVLNNEIIGMVKRILAGIDTSDEALAVAVIEEIGPQGNFLAHPHTAENFKKVWYPELLDRNSYDQWKIKGAATLEERVQERTTAILKNHQPEELPEETRAVINAIVLAQEEELVNKRGKG